MDREKKKSMPFFTYSDRKMKASAAVLRRPEWPRNALEITDGMLRLPPFLLWPMDPRIIRLRIHIRAGVDDRRSLLWLLGDAGAPEREAHAAKTAVVAAIKGSKRDGPETIILPSIFRRRGWGRSCSAKRHPRTLILRKVPLTAC